MSEDLETVLCYKFMKIYDNGDESWAFRRLARECLRQMSWARFMAVADHLEAATHNQRTWDLGGGRYKSYSPTEIETLAPNDWTPK